VTHSCFASKIAKAKKPKKISHKAVKAPNDDMARNQIAIKVQTTLHVQL